MSDTQKPEPLNLNLPKASAQGGKAAGAGGGDRWLGPDKAKHFAVSGALGCAAGLAVENPTAAFALALIPGAAKEYWDSKHPGHTPSMKDMTANAAGAAVGVVTCQALKSALSDNGTKQPGGLDLSRTSQPSSGISGGIAPTGPKSVAAFLHVKY